jgi:hypothetical protein
VGLNGGPVSLLNPGDFNHQSAMSESARYFVDNFSRVNTVPTSALFDGMGRKILDLETADFALLQAAGYQFPETFKVERGEILGFLGPNGAGKTTLFRMVLGEESTDGGEIQIAKGVKIGYLPQEVIGLRGSSVLEEVLKGAAGISTLQDKMQILEQELSSIEDPKRQERLAKEYGRLQERYTFSEDTGWRRRPNGS